MLDYCERAKFVLLKSLDFCLTMFLFLVAGPTILFFQENAGSILFIIFVFTKIWFLKYNSGSTDLSYAFDIP